MTLEDYADAINADIVIRRFNCQSNRWIADFDGAEVKEGATLAGVYGTGQSPADALQEYISLIVDKRIVFNAGGENRREFTVPSKLEL